MRLPDSTRAASSTPVTMTTSMTRTTRRPNSSDRARLRTELTRVFATDDLGRPGHADAHEGTPPRRRLVARADHSREPRDRVVRARPHHDDAGEGQAAASGGRAPGHQGQAG